MLIAHDLDPLAHWPQPIPTALALLTAAALETFGPLTTIEERTLTELSTAPDLHDPRYQARQAADQRRAANAEFGRIATQLADPATPSSHRQLLEAEAEHWRQHITELTDAHQHHSRQALIANLGGNPAVSSLRDAIHHRQRTLIHRALSNPPLWLTEHDPHSVAELLALVEHGVTAIDTGHQPPAPAAIGLHDLTR